MTKTRYIALAVIGAAVCSAIGGYAFGQWMNSTAAGWFAFIALDAVYDIAIGLRIVSSCDHVTGEK